MGFFSKIKEWLNRMTSAKEITDKIDTELAISNEMVRNIEEWDKLYCNKGTVNLNKGEKPRKNLNLPYRIADKKSSRAVLELKVKIYDPNTEELAEDEINENDLAKTRAGYMNKQFDSVLSVIRNKLTYAIALGTMVIKPVVDIEENEINFVYVMANKFYPIAFNMKGKLIHAVFEEKITKGNKIYTRLESHKLENGTITITNQAFLNYNGSKSELGDSIPLSNLLEWANLSPEIKISSANSVKLNRLLVATFVMPNANNIDPESKMGMSGFASAISMIDQANELYNSLNWEMKGGELAIIVADSVLRDTVDRMGNISSTMSEGDKRIFKTLAIDSADDKADFLQVFSPTLRDVSYINSLSNQLRMIEDTVGLSRGSLSLLDTVEKTASEIGFQKQETFETNKSIQQALQTTFEDLIYVIDVLTSLYNLAPAGEYKVAYEWDDSILVNVAQELKERASLVSLGAMEPDELTAWYLNIPVEQRIKQRATIKEVIKEYNIDYIEEEVV